MKRCFLVSVRTRAKKKCVGNAVFGPRFGPTSLASYLPQLLHGLQHPRDGPVASAHQNAQVGHHPDVAPQRRGRSLRGQIHDLHRVDVVAVREQLHERSAPATAALAVHEAQQRFPLGRRRRTRRLGRPGRARLVPLHALLVRRPGARGRVRARDVPRPRARRGKRRGRPSSSPGRSLRRSSKAARHRLGRVTPRGDGAAAAAASDDIASAGIARTTRACRNEA
jgi:hypothetical protein